MRIVLAFLRNTTKFPWYLLDFSLLFCILSSSSTFIFSRSFFFHCRTGPYPLEILHIHQTNQHLQCFKRIRFDYLLFGWFHAGSVSQSPFSDIRFSWVIILFDSSVFSLARTVSLTHLPFSHRVTQIGCGRAPTFPTPRSLTQSYSLTVLLLLGSGQMHIKP